MACLKRDIPQLRGDDHETPQARRSSPLPRAHGDHLPPHLPSAEACEVAISNRWRYDGAAFMLGFTRRRPERGRGWLNRAVWGAREGGMSGVVIVICMAASMPGTEKAVTEVEKTAFIRLL